MKRSLEQYFLEYEAYHRTTGNKACHWVGIPLIMLSLLGLLAGIGPGHFNAATALWLFSTLFYLALTPRLGLPFGLVTLGFYFAGRGLPSQALWPAFALGWIAQGVGHAFFERKAPAFIKNLEHILIGPLWLFNRLIRKN